MVIPIQQVQEPMMIVDQATGLTILFVAGFGPMTADSAASQVFYQQTLNLPLKGMPGNDTYLSLEEGALAGVTHFAVWPLAQAALSCLGRQCWPQNILVPQSWIEFEVDALDVATLALKAQGYHLLVDNREEPWGQRVTRLLSPEGLLVGLTITPWLREA